MSVSLSTLASTASSVSAIIAAAKAVGSALTPVYDYVVNLIEIAEAAYTGIRDAGGSKKAAVLAATKAFVVQLGIDWDGIVSALSAFIDAVVSAYNTAVEAVTGLFNDSAEAESV